MRDTDRPAVSIHFADGTPEEAAHNREYVESVFRSALLRGGDNRKLNISWDAGALPGKFENPSAEMEIPGNPDDKG